MSKVFTELVTLGMSEESAIEIAESLNIHNALVTKDYLRAELAEIRTDIHKMESKLLWGMVSALVGSAAIFGLFMTIAAWLVK